MTDRELLEKAAMAAGLHVDMRSTVPDWLWVRESTTHGPYRQWCPLADDGDALRLAVALRISLSMLPQIVDATAGDVMCHEPWDDDPHAATRRAIVRAAAAMAEAIHPQ